MADVAKKLADQEQRLLREQKELDLLVESTQTEVNRLKTREEQARAKLDDVRQNPGNYQRDDIFAAYDEYGQAVERRVTMDGQLGALQSKRKLTDRVRLLVAEAAVTAQEIPASAGASGESVVPAAVDEGKLLQAIVDTQEEERKRIARQVHDGPAQALSNVVLQTEISERLFDVDPQRSRTELAALRLQVNKTLQELRGFIFELRPMILDDLGLVPTLRRYVQTLVDKHGARIDFGSSGRDRRLPPDDEVAVFRLIQDSLVERLDRGQARKVQLVMTWKDEVLEVLIQSDGKELTSDVELASGLRRSERLELLKAEAAHETRPDGTIVLNVKIPVRAVQTVS